MFIGRRARLVPLPAGRRFSRAALDSPIRASEGRALLVVAGVQHGRKSMQSRECDEMNTPLEARSIPAQGQKTMSTWSLLVWEPDAFTTSLRQVWRELLAASDDPFALYQSPEWFDLRRGLAAADSMPSLAIRRNSARQVIGVVPLYPAEEPCTFPIALKRAYVTRPRKMILIQSGRLLLPAGDRWFDGLFASLCQANREGCLVKIQNVPVPSPLNTYIETSPLIARRYCTFAVPGLSQVHTIPLPSTYDEFLDRYRSKKRYNLRRQIRQLEQHAKGGLELRCFESADDLPEFVAHWDALAAACDPRRDEARSIAARRDTLRRRAELGLMCSYLLMDGSRPIAGFLADCYGSTFMLGKTLHDEAYSPFSPGSCLLHMVIEALIRERGVRLINLGYGLPAGSYRATNIVLDFAAYWLFPRTWKTRLFQIGYGLLRRGIVAAKSISAETTPSDEPI
jgi:Acetyltransferase (GNAT) domain